MKYPKLTFYKSAKGDIEYFIYRFKNREPDIPIEYYVNNDKHIGTISESQIDSDITLVDFKTTRMDDLKEYPKYIHLSTPFHFIRPNTNLKINMKNNHIASTLKSIKVYFGSTVISKIEYIEYGEVVKTITIADDINYLIKVINPNTILLRKKEFDCDFFTIDVTIKTAQYIDTEAHGLYDPIISIIEANNYISFYQELHNHSNTYYYKSIGRNNNSQITEESKTVACKVAEAPSKIRTILEASEDYYYTENHTWKVVSDTKMPTEEIRVQKSDIASSIIPTIGNHELYINDNLLSSDGIRVIKIPNIWHKEKRKIMFRPKKVFRVKNILKNSTLQTEYTKPIVFDGLIEILIDKMVILKKNVTGMSQSESLKPLEVGKDGAEIIKVFVRQGGIYYKEYFLNEFETNNPDFSTELVSSVTLDSRFPLFSIKDSCIFTNKYNYTVYLYDETGKVSKPITIVV